MMSDLMTRLKAAQQDAISGWDFSALDGRWESDELEWDYAEVVRRYLKKTDRLLDMGTGGGEFLLSLGHEPSLCSVTEGYAPNLALCRERLSPLGMTVKECNNEGALPFEAGCLDIVINRHESYLPEAVRDVLREGGAFVTQQVGGANNRAMSQFLIDGFTSPYPEHYLAPASEKLAKAGFDIQFGAECFPRLRFFDIGAVVFFAKTIEWEFPDFSVERCFDKLKAISETIEKDGFFESVEHRFIIAAVKK